MYFQTDPDLNEKFIKSGILPDRKIALLCKNSEEYVKLLIQIIFWGGVAIPVSTVMPTAKVHSMLKNINCSKIIVGEGIEYKDDVLIRSFSLKYFSEKLVNINLRKTINGFDIYRAKKNLDGNASIFFTSGSTCIPKAVLHTFNNHWYNAIGSNMNILFKKGDCWMVALPLNHVSGFSAIFKTLAGKADIYIKPSGMALLDSLSLNSQITHISLIPAQLSELIRDISGVEILRRLKAILIGGSSATQRLMEESKDLGLNVYNSYGSTEMSSQITCTVKNDSADHLKTSGKLLKYRELKISSENEILVKGETLFKGYIRLNNSGNPYIRKLVDKEGWFSTNDLGFMDEEGYLHVFGRKDLMFVCNGENIFPEEIEDALREIKDIEDAIVVPLDKPENGQIPAAFLKSKNKLTLDHCSIRNNLMKKLECFKVPEIYLEWPYDLEKKSMKPDRESYKKRAIDLIKQQHG